MHLLLADCDANFDLHLNTVCEVIPWMHAAGRHTHAKFLPMYTLKIINLSKWCLKQQVSKLANLNAIFLLDDSQMLITYYSD